MAIRNNNLLGSDFVDDETLYAADLNDTNDALSFYAKNALITSGTNIMRDLIDRDIDFSKGNFDWWGDAYIDVNGRENSVSTDTSLTTAFPDTTNEKFEGLLNNVATDATHDPDTFSNPTSAFNLNTASYAIAPTLAENVWFSLGKTFSAKYIKKVYIKATASRSNGRVYVRLETYNGSTWDIIQSWGGGESVSIDTVVDISASVQGVRASFMEDDYNDGWGKLYVLAYGETEQECQISHTIPSGTFGTTISNVIGIPFIEDWETGADIKYKLTGSLGSDDTGWLDCSNTPRRNTFTAFSSGEPDTLIVKLIPKTTLPTSGYPSLRGFVVRAE